MAQSGGAAEAGAAKDCVELKEELRRLVRAIAEEDDVQIKTFDEAKGALAALREVKFGGERSSEGKRSPSPSPLLQETKKGDRIGSPAIPKHFLCPISKALMRDPVILASGQTYDRSFIQEWLNAGNRTCLLTKAILPNTTLIPNILLRNVISKWCVDHGILLPAPKSQDEALITEDEQNVLDKLLNRISSALSIAEEKEALKQLRLITKCNQSFRALIEEKQGAIPKLLSVLSLPGLKDDPEAQEDAVATILNISTHDKSKMIVGDDPLAIPFLIDTLKNGTMAIETRGNAAAALATLSILHSNNLKIGELGAIGPLLELLLQGCESAKEDAASAIVSLCMVPENRARALNEGAVRVLLEIINGQSFVDRPLAILAQLSGDPMALEEIGKSGLPCLLRVMRKSSSNRCKENAATAVFAVCEDDRKKLTEVGMEEKSHGTISALANNGTSRARRKAAGILKWLKSAQDPKVILRIRGCN